MYGKVWKMEWNCMEDFACYGRWNIYIPFHSMPCLAQALNTMNLVELEFLLCEWSPFDLSALLFRLC